MKKFTKVLLLSIVTVCILTGCYQQEVSLKFKHSGAEFKAEIAATDDAYNYYCNQNNKEEPITHKEILDQNVPYLQGYTEKDSSLSFEEIEKEVDGEKYYGLKAGGKFSSAQEMLGSEFFSNLNMAYFYKEDEGLSDYIEKNHVGISFKENSNIVGTTYKLYGYVSLSQGKTITGELSADELGELKNAKSVLKLKFPAFSFSFSKGCKFFLAPSFDYNLNFDTPDLPVNISVFVPNLAMLISCLIILLLLIVIILLLKKIKLLTPVPVVSGSFEEETLSEDDENFFEGNEENTEFSQNEDEEVIEEIVEENENINTDEEKPQE